jgi:hypothetical protein
MVDKVEIRTGDEVPSAGTTDHLQEMLEVAESAENPEVSDRPEWLPNKFDSPEALAQAYTELEQRMGRQGQEQQEDSEWTHDEDNVSVETEEDPSEVQNFLASRGLDFNQFQEEFNQSGGLSEDAYGALEKAGMGKTNFSRLMA